MPAIFHFGLKSFFKRYWAPPKLLSDAYVVMITLQIGNQLDINDFLCDGYVIEQWLLMDGNWIKN